MNRIETFNNGLSFDEFLNSSESKYKDATLDFYNNMELGEDLISQIKNIDKEINVLVCAELWCPDCIVNVPAVQIFNELNENIKISIIEKEGYEDEFSKIPTFIIYDNKFNELGRFIERPKIIKKIENEGTQPEIIVAKRQYRKGKYILDTVQDILDIIK